MAKPEWGTKRMCQNCGTRFYDMRRDPPTCPACDTVFTAKASVRQRRTATPAAEKTDPAQSAPEEVAASPDTKGEEQDSPASAPDDDALLEVDDDAEGLDAEAKDDSLMEDTSDLGEDDDDMSEVMEHIDNEDMSDRGQ
ncbi:MAG: TIGR02300 family protein [Rhodospirillales bacterium]|nr:TIGR02300 family protein [Rhodospirillales bacterium]